VNTRRPASSTRKKVVVAFIDGTSAAGYLNPAQLIALNTPEFLSAEGELQGLNLQKVKMIYFVKEFTGDPEPERKAFLSRPKLDGLWVRLTFNDGETLEGVVANDLLVLLDSGVQITPPDTSNGTLRIFVPRSSLSGMTVLGVIGIARRKIPAPTAVPPQPKLFSE
jgi:hypothetical protein